MSERPHRRPRTASERSAPARLSDLDHEILGVAVSMRVVTQTQLERLHPRVPGRTLRYRTQRLHRLRLLGRTRPYRDSGSAPHHLWPTRAADALVRGEPPPRRGERRPPNPLALAHSAALTELYVVLATQADAVGLRFSGLDREGEAREPFNDLGGRERAIAPDLLIELRDADDRRLLAHVELDLGTMSHARLRTKLDGYLTYTERHAWHHRHPFQPALLFITTSRQRAETFRSSADRMVRSKRWAGASHFPLAVCGRARHLAGTLAVRCWLGLEDNESRTLGDLLARARASYDEDLARMETKRREDEAERDRLIADPAALRDHLREGSNLRDAMIMRLGEPEATALKLLAGTTTELHQIESAALRALGPALAAHLPAALYDSPAIEDLDPTLVGELADHYRDRQRQQIGDAAARHGVGPTLRAADQTLRDGGLLDPQAVRFLESDAIRDERARNTQQERRAAYLDFRDAEARRRARNQPLATRIRRGGDSYLADVDTDYVQTCSSCGELNYPIREGAGYHRVHLCLACASELDVSGTR